VRIDDLIVFGRTAPEESKKYGQSVCLAGYSEELRQFVRVYPIDIRTRLKARSKITVEVERNSKDSRAESWALKGRSEKAILGVTSPLDKDTIRPILEANAAASIDDLNKAKVSLGVIKPEQYMVQLKTRSNIEIPGQQTLFDSFKIAVGVKSANSYFHAPYLLVNNGGQSCLQIREWGIYELMRKYEDAGRAVTTQDITNGLHIGGGKDVYFVVGNMVSVRNVWLVIKAFSYKKHEQGTLL